MRLEEIERLESQMDAIKEKQVDEDELQRLKDRNSYWLLGEFEHILKQFWGRHFWVRGYFCCSSGNVTDEVVKAYIENRGKDEDVQ